MTINSMFALVDEDGEIHWPKDDKRRTMTFTKKQEKELMEQVFADVEELVDWGDAPMSPGWLRQLGREAQAVEMEQEDQRLLDEKEAAAQDRLDKAALARENSQSERGKRRKLLGGPVKPDYVIKEIHEERTTTGFAAIWYACKC